MTDSKRNRTALLGAKAQPLDTVLVQVTQCDFFLRLVPSPVRDPSPDSGGGVRRFFLR